MTYEIILQGSDADFEPIEANDIHDACRKTREILANPNVFAYGTEPFMAEVTVMATDGQATVRMPVECAYQSFK